MSIINKPIGWILNQLSELVGGNFAAAVFLLTLIVQLVLIPLSIKSQKSNAKQAKVKPKLDALKKKYGSDKVKYNEEMQKLYQQEGVSLSGGCLPMLVRLPIMMGIYYAVVNPLTNLLNMSADVITKAKELCGEIVGKVATELDVIKHADQLIAKVPELADVSKLNFSLFGIDLKENPSFSLNIFEDFRLIWLIPILSFATAMLTSIFTMAINKKNNPDAPNMRGMMITMPIFSLVIAFTVPGAVGFYWICSNIVSGTIQIILQQVYSPTKIIAEGQAKQIVKRHEYEIVRMEKALYEADVNE